MAYADVVVQTQSALLLSVLREDFVRVLKEILGIRQQDRILYLAMHPLFHTCPQEDLQVEGGGGGHGGWRGGGVYMVMLYINTCNEGREVVCREGQHTHPRTHPNPGPLPKHTQNPGPLPSHTQTLGPSLSTPKPWAPPQDTPKPWAPP